MSGLRYIILMSYVQRIILAALALVKLALKVLVLGLIVPICYQPFAYLVGVRTAASPKRPKAALTLRQILFSVLYTFVPWIPLFTFLWATLPTLRGSLLDLRHSHRMDLLLLRYLQFRQGRFGDYKVFKKAGVGIDTAADVSSFRLHSVSLDLY